MVEKGMQPTFADIMKFVVLPFVVCGLLVVILSAASLGQQVVLWNLSITIAVLVGFGSVIKKYKMHSLWMGLIYLPVMYYWLYEFSYTFVSFFFTDWP